MLSPSFRSVLVFCLALTCQSLSLAQNVWTWHNDNNRTGWQQSEYTLNAGNVTQTGFGLLWQWPVQGFVYAQPLAFTLHQSVGNCANPCSLVFIATEKDMLYAFNAASSSQTPIWSVNLAGQLGGGTYIDCANPPSNFHWCENGGTSVLGHYVGITGTPVIDSSSNTLYVVAAAAIPTAPLAYYFLFAVDITSGNIKASTVISGSVSGQAPSGLCGQTHGGSTDVFDVNHIQRSGLLLLNGKVYIAFSSGPVQGEGEFNNGWLFGYQLGGNSLTQTAIFNTTPNGTGGGIWMSGAAPASDGSYIYLTTANGTFDLVAPSGGFVSTDTGDTVLKLTPPNSPLVTPTIADYYSPFDVFNYPPPSGGGLCANDEDFGSGGVLLIPDVFYNSKNLVVNADKQSNIYVADRTNLGGLNQSSNCTNNFNNIQCITSPPIPSNDPGQGYWASPAYWKYMSGGATNYMLYYAPTTETKTVAPKTLNGYQLRTTGSSGPVPSAFASSFDPVGQQAVLFCSYSPTPSGSSDGAASTTGIVWAIEHQNSRNPTDCNGSPGPAALHAFAAVPTSSNLTQLYNSGTTSANNHIGHWITFSTPTVFKGQVYMGTQTEVDVFGLCSSQSSGCMQ